MNHIPPGPIAAKILNEIRTSKLGKKYTQKEFADLINRSRATISNIEREEGVLTRQILQSISEAFNMSIEELIPPGIYRRLEDPFAKDPAKLVISPKEEKPSEDLIESLKEKIFKLEEENRRVISERDRLFVIIENMSKGAARS